MPKFVFKSSRILQIPSLFKNPKPKRFQYKPHYYNAQKEQLDQRIRLIKAEEKMKAIGIDSEHPIKEMYAKRKTESRRSNKITAIAAMVLFVLAYYFLFK